MTDRKKIFYFKNFKLHHHQSTLKIGTDAVLLGAWTDVNSAKNVLDIGCGCGVISFIIAQKLNVDIFGIDIDENSITEANFNISINNFTNKISFICSSLQEFVLNSNQKFDLIVSNPPYFNNSLKPSDERIIKAKHADNSLTISELLVCSKSVLSDKGSVNIILPADQEHEFDFLCEHAGFFCQKKLYIKPNYVNPPKRILYRLILSACTCEKSTISIETEHRHKYSPQYIDLVKDFYLNMDS